MQRLISLSTASLSAALLTYALTAKAVIAEVGVEMAVQPGAAILAVTPSGLPSGSQIVGTKTFTWPNYDGRKRDGEVAFTVNNVHLTVYHLRLADGSFRTAAIADFTQINHTQNDKGSHNHYVHFYPKGSAGNILDPNTLTVELERDTCSPSNPKISRLHEFQTDMFSQFQTAGLNWSGKWNQEGHC